MNSSILMRTVHYRQTEILYRSLGFFDDADMVREIADFYFLEDWLAVKMALMRLGREGLNVEI